MATTSIWRVKGWLGKVVIYAENPEKTANPKFYADRELTEQNGQQLSDVIRYAVNSEKTQETGSEDGAPLHRFVSGINCSPATARDEMLAVKKRFGKEDGTVAYHGYQSFAPGEATPEQAHEIGKQLADEVLQGKYSYVLTTHIDKGHVHNHLIFCAVDMVNHRKYNSNRQSYAYIRRTSDRLCREHGLSVVQPSRDKGKSYAEWDAGRKGKSWKAKLKAAIDAVIPQAKNFDDFLRLMAAQGYEIKQGKFISFRAPGQERFTRCKTLGEDYTEERITQRIKGIAIDRGPRRRSDGEISLRIALEDSIKAQQSAGYARWAKLHNLKQAANSLNFITEHQIDSYEGLESRLAEISAANDAAASALKDAERRLGDMALLIKNLSAYKQLRPVALELRNAKDKAAFRRQHESQLILYEAAAKALKEAGITKLPNLYALKTEYKKLDAERERLSAQYSEAKQKLKEYGIVKQNVDSILRTAPGKEHTQER